MANVANMVHAIHVLSGSAKVASIEGKGFALAIILNFTKWDASDWWTYSILGILGGIMIWKAILLLRYRPEEDKIDDPNDAFRL